MLVSSISPAALYFIAGPSYVNAVQVANTNALKFRYLLADFDYQTTKMASNRPHQKDIFRIFDNKNARFIRFTEIQN